MVIKKLIKMRKEENGPVSELLLELLDFGPFLVCELPLLDIRREVVEPAFTALLGLAVVHVSGNERPVRGPVRGHQRLEKSIFLISPVLRASMAGKR